MTTNDATPREATEYSARERVAMYLLFHIDDHSIKPRHMVEKNWEMRKRAREMEPQSLLLMHADSAIAEYNRYLWERAESTEVVEAVDRAMERIGVNTSRNEDESILEEILTALLGPRPSGEEAE